MGNIYFWANLFFNLWAIFFAQFIFYFRANFFLFIFGISFLLSGQFYFWPIYFLLSDQFPICFWVNLILFSGPFLMFCPISFFLFLSNFFKGNWSKKKRNWPKIQKNWPKINLIYFFRTENKKKSITNFEKKNKILNQKKYLHTWKL